MFGSHPTSPIGPPARPLSTPGGALARPACDQPSPPDGPPPALEQAAVRPDEDRRFGKSGKRESLWEALRW
jgi:hypothetical protein